MKISEFLKKAGELVDKQFGGSPPLARTVGVEAGKPVSETLDGKGVKGRILGRLQKIIGTPNGNRDPEMTNANVASLGLRTIDEILYKVAGEIREAVAEYYANFPPNALIVQNGTTQTGSVVIYEEVKGKDVDSIFAQLAPDLDRLVKRSILKQ